MSDRRLLPHNLSCEASILGGVLLRNQVLADLVELEVDDFYDHRHRIVFQAMRNLEAAARPIDVATVEAEIEKGGKIDAIGGVAFLGELALRVPTPDNVMAYTETVRDHAMVRRLALAAADITERAYNWEYSATELLGDAMAAIAKLDRSRPDDAQTIGELAMRRAKELEELIAARAAGGTVLTGVPTGIAKLDERLGGWQFGIANLLAARPAMGKTATAIATTDAATSAGYGTHVFALEDGWRALADRAISREAQISAERLRQGEIAGEDVRSVSIAVAKLSTRRNWLVDGRAGLSAQEIIRSVRRHRSRLNTRLVVIDYVQLVRRTPKLSENDALDEIITAFATAAKADDMAYLVLSQLNREVEKRVDKRPQMSDLRGSGALEERPKIIVGQYRGVEYYAKPKRHIDYECDCEDDVKTCGHAPSVEQFQRTAQLLVLKNSNGQTGRVFATWRGETTEIW